MKYLYTQSNGNIVIEMGTGGKCSINEAEYPAAWKQVQDWIAEGGIVQPEPLPPPPTDAQLEAAAEAQRQALFAEYDTAIMRIKRAERMGDTTATASIAQWDEYAVALQMLNDSAGWFRDTVWPTKPEV